MSELSDVDFIEQEAAQAASVSGLATVGQIAMRMAALEIHEAKIEAALERVRKELTFTKTRLVPDAMGAANTTAFTIAEGEFQGVQVAIDNFVSGSLPKEPAAKAAAIAWLEQNDGAPLVKNQVVIDLPKGSNRVGLLLAWLEENDFTFDRVTNVHPQSLMAFGRARLRDGKPLDETKLGLFIGRVAKLIWPKGR